MSIRGAASQMQVSKTKKREVKPALFGFKRLTVFIKANKTKPWLTDKSRPVSQVQPRKWACTR